MIVGLVRPNAGQVTFKERDVTDYPIVPACAHGHGVSAQEESIFRKLTVEQNLLAILETRP